MAHANLKPSIPSNKTLSKSNIDQKINFVPIVSSGQSYKVSTIVIYELRVVNTSNLLVSTALES